VERTFKEVLYRFLEEIHCTKSALYLLTSEDTYGLATQYGFGRRDALAAEHRRGEPLVALAHEQRSSPRPFNDAAHNPDLAPYLEGAGTARLLLAPLYEGSRVLGFVDARDKGRKAPFTARDVAGAAAITGAMLELIRRLRLYPDAEEPPTPELPSLPAHDEVGPEGERPSFDEASLRALLDGAHLVVRIGAAEAVSVSVISGSRGSSRMFSSSTLPEEARRAIVDHQRGVLAEAGLAPPEAGDWRVGVRRVGDGSPPSPARTVASAVLLGQGEWAVTASVVAARSGVGPAAPLDLLRRIAGSARAAAEGRWVRRRLVWTLAESVKTVSEELSKHLLAVSHMSWSLAVALGCDGAEVEGAALAGMVHDLGLGEIVEQEGYRAPPGGGDHRRVFRRHVELGEQRLRKNGLDDLAAVVRSHHERWDGAGYPDRLAGDAIVPAARIVSVAEVWDVLTADHSYRQTLAPGRALAIIKAAAGSQFEPRVVKALEEVLE